MARRSEMMLQVAHILETEKEKWAHLMTLEMGKPILSAIQEASKSALACKYYAENAASFLEDQIVPTQADQSYVHFQPLGPVLAIMPWNFPFWQVFRFAAPALMAGNVGLLKHASNVPQCALAIEEIFRRAGFPDGVFQTLLISATQSDRVLEDPRVVGVSLTGSDVVGASVAARAGKLIKKAVLELGGSDPFIVMPMSSAHLQQAVQVAVQSRMINNGESCIAAKRFILAESIADEFQSRFTSTVKELRVGDPMDPETQIGPLATPDILHGVQKQVEESVKKGARIRAGGRVLPQPGNFYDPTVLTDIPKGSPAYEEEIFGPVASLFRVKNITEAIQLANDTRFGLGASIWTTDPHDQIQFIEEIESGLCFINGMVASDPRMPFGGVKKSGYGRELGKQGIFEFVNAKTVSINRTLR